MCVVGFQPSAPEGGPRSTSSLEEPILMLVTLTGKSLTGKSLTGKSLTGKSLTGKSLTGKSLTENGCAAADPGLLGRRAWSGRCRLGGPGDSDVEAEGLNLADVVTDLA